MLHVDQSRIRRFGGVVPFSSGGFPARVLCGGDDFKILVVQLAVNFLPAWQIETASSPGGPGDYQRFLAAKIGEVDDLPLAVGNGEIGSDARVIEATAEDGNFAEAPDVLVGDERLANLMGKSGEVKPLAVFQSFRKRDTDIGAAGALRFDLEFIDAREVFRLNPEVLLIGAGLIEDDGVVAEQDSGARSWRHGEGQRCTTGD
jgi:hypothetical protein